MTTFRKLIKMYSQSVNTGQFDNDLTKRQRHYLHVLLNLASNNYMGEIAYGSVTDTLRQNICKGMGKDAENVRWFLNDKQERDFYFTLSRAVQIIKNI